MKTLSISIIAALLLSVAGSFIINEVSAQVACTSDSQCSTLGPEFRCVSNRCNLPPPIWNLTPGTISGGQVGSFDVSGNSQVRGNFSIGTGFDFPAGTPLGSVITAGNVYSNAFYSRTTGSDNIWLGDTNDTVQIQGALTVSGVTINGNLGLAGNITLTTAGATVDGVNLDLVLTNITTSSGGLAITGTGNSRNVALISSCTDGQVLKWSTATRVWGCAADATEGVGGGGGTYTAGQYVTIGADNSISAVHSGTCFGPIFRQLSALARDGNRGGYINANTECPAGMHVCKTSEILEAINCGAFSGAGLTDGTLMWVNNLAPSLPTPTNDCGGWQNNAASAVGVSYRYTVGGGTGGTTPCNQALRFACCQ